MAIRRLVRPLAAARIALSITSRQNHTRALRSVTDSWSRRQQSPSNLFSREKRLFISGCGFQSRAFASGALPPHMVLGMPALSPTMAHGNIVSWKKKVGDQVLPGDVLCVIETDKATVDFESVEEGYLAKILVSDGAQNVPVGKNIGVLAETSEDLAKLTTSDFGATDSKPPQAAPSPQPEPVKSSPKLPPTDLPPCIVLGMPALSPTMTHGNVVSWKKKEGDQITAGDVLCLIETDKATVDFESVEDGYLAKILVPGGSNNIQIGQTIGVMVESTEDIPKIASAEFGAGPEPSERPAAKTSTSTEAPKPVTPFSSDLTRVGPSVRRLLAESGLDGNSIRGTGPKGAILKGDVLAAMKGGVPAQKPQKDVSPSRSPSSSTLTTTSFEDKPNSQIRKVIAKRLLESKLSIPHFYLSGDALLDRTLSLRKEMKEKHGVAVSVNDFVIKATALALKNVPEANAYWDEKSGEIVLHDSVDISIAVATEKGLITPIVRNADKKSLSSISTEVKALAEKARNGKLKPEEFQGGTFSISNLGMYPVDRFCAIINPPQACILAVGRGEKVVTWEETAGKPVTVTRMGLTLSADNRVYDTTVAGRFLEALSANLEDPSRMLL